MVTSCGCTDAICISRGLQKRYKLISEKSFEMSPSFVRLDSSLPAVKSRIEMATDTKNFFANADQGALRDWVIIGSNLLCAFLLAEELASSTLRISSLRLKNRRMCNTIWHFVALS